jgi:CRISPR-associated protein Cas5d
MNLVEVKVWGDYACFTRPENKVERVSYDVMTPSAARGVLEGILWKPRMRYRIREIAVLKPIRRASILRNEINTVQSAGTAQRWQKSGGGYVSDEDRAQRHALVLRDVAYVIRAEIQLTSIADADESIQKYLAMFKRRVEHGQSFRQPYLGTREFSANFAAPEATDTPIEHSDELGRMLLDIAFTPRKKGTLKYLTHDAAQAQVTQGQATPIFFRARLENGVLRVPDEEYKRLEGVK